MKTTSSKTTLTEVIQRAKSDAAFLKALIKSPSKALKANKLELSEDDLKELRSKLRVKVPMSLGKFLEVWIRAHKAGVGIYPWPTEIQPYIEVKGGRMK